jgi:hypothetical protein
MRLITFLLLFASLGSYSQDILRMMDGKELSVKVIEITPEFIKYKLFTQQQGPVRNISVKDVNFIKYSDGFTEFFSGTEETVKESAPKIEERVVEPVATPIPEEKQADPAPAEPTKIESQPEQTPPTIVVPEEIPTDIKSETPVEQAPETIIKEEPGYAPSNTITPEPTNTFVNNIPLDRFENEFDFGLIFGITRPSNRTAKSIYGTSLAFNMPFIWWNKRNGSGFELSAPLIAWGYPMHDNVQANIDQTIESKSRMSVISLTYNVLYRIKPGRSYKQYFYGGAAAGISYFNETIKSKWEYFDTYGYSYTNDIRYTYNKFPFTVSYILGYRLSVLNISIQYSLIQVSNARIKNKMTNVGGFTYSIGFRF